MANLPLPAKLALLPGKRREHGFSCRFGSSMLIQYKQFGDRKVALYLSAAVGPPVGFGFAIATGTPIMPRLPPLPSFMAISPAWLPGNPGWLAVGDPGYVHLGQGWLQGSLQAGILVQ